MLSRHLNQRDFLHLLLLVPLAFCLPKLAQTGRASPCSWLCGHRAVQLAPQKGSALPWWSGSRVFALCFKQVGGEAVSLDCRASCVPVRITLLLGCRLHPEVDGRSVLGFPWPGGYLEEDQTWDDETGGKRPCLNCSSAWISSRLKTYFNFQCFLLFSFQHLVWKALLPMK